MATAWGNLPGLNRGKDIAISGLTAAGTYMTVGVGVDLDNDTAQFIVGDDTSFGAAQSISGISGAIFPMWAGFNGDICIANFGASAFEHQIAVAIAGFSGWDAACVWNSADKDAGITLSGGDLEATRTAASAWKGVRATVSKTTGRLYFEIKVKLNTANGNQMVGVGNASATLTNYFSVNTHGASFQSNGNFGYNNGFTAVGRAYDEYSNDWRTILSDTYHTTGRYYVEVLANAISSSSSGLIIGIGNGSVPLNSFLGSDAAGNSCGFQATRQFHRGGGSTSNVLPSALTATHVIGLDIDLDLGTIAANIDGGSYSAAQSIASLLGKGIRNVPIFFCISFLDAPSTYDSITVNFGATAFTYSAPGSAVSWDTSPGTLETRFSTINRSSLLYDVGKLNVSYLGRSSLNYWDSPLNVTNVYRMALVSNSVSGAGTSLFVGAAYRTVLIAETPPPAATLRQSAVTVT